LKVYKYSDDDAYLNQLITSNGVFEKGITVTQNYEKDSNTETETFKSEKVVTLFDNLPVVTMNDRESSTEIVIYSFKGGIERYLTA
jgi:intein/homing endonuclease